MAQITLGKNNLRGRVAFIALLAACLATPTIALAQAMPWAGGAPQPPMQAPPPPPPGQPFYDPTHGPHAAMAPMSRAQDDRELNLLATKFYAIHPQSDPGAFKKLKNLAFQVSRFRKELKMRPYDVRDILHDAKKLQGRIAAQRNALRAAGGMTAPAHAPAPAPSSMSAPVEPVTQSSTPPVPEPAPAPSVPAPSSPAMMAPAPAAPESPTPAPAPEPGLSAPAPAPAPTSMAPLPMDSLPPAPAPSGSAAPTPPPSGQ